MLSNRIWFSLATKSLLVLAAFSLAALCLAACASSPSNPARTAANPVELYPLKAEMKPDQVALALHASGFSPAQVEALTALVQRWREGGDIITVQAPRAAADPALAARAQSGARDRLIGLGVPAAAIRLEAYDAPDSGAPLLVSFSRYQGQTLACRNNWDNLTSTRDNNVMSNFGCAVTSNMAAQIANASDIVQPRGTDAPDGERRQTVMGLYAAGKLTASADDPAKSGAVSKAVP